MISSYHGFDDAVDSWCHNSGGRHAEVDGQEGIAIDVRWRAGDLLHPRLVHIFGCRHGEYLDPFVPSVLRRYLDPTTGVAGHMAIGDHHRKLDHFCYGGGTRNLQSHIGQGTVNVSASAQVNNVLQTSDEVASTGYLTEDLTPLGEVESTKGPRDLHHALVVHII